MFDHSVRLILNSYFFLNRLVLQMTGSNEYKLNQGPDDSISAVKFSPSTTQFLLVSSWDCTVRLYDVGSNTMRMKYQHTAPVLDCAFYVGHKILFIKSCCVSFSKNGICYSLTKIFCLQDPTHSWSGGLDTQLKTHDLNTDQGM